MGDDAAKAGGPEFKIRPGELTDVAPTFENRSKALKEPLRTPMNSYLAGFFESYLNIETAQYVDRLKQTVTGLPNWSERLRKLFDELLTERTATRGEFCDHTFIEFETDEEMYAYLEEVRAYLFLGATEIPLAPD
ncbi:hypothetical protein ABTZ03_05955 [Kitasatospora sp. NPDC096077]|uniref:hypothetical protein n=1 Tax=Kitasatospora sp. NPDC096077 TaxID=3155544 RepID=UPI003332300B